MCKNTRISGLKVVLIASLLNVSTSPTLYSEMPWAIFCCRDDKDVKILPGISSRKVKKCTPLEKLFYSFGATAGIDCSLQSKQNYLCCVLRIETVCTNGVNYVPAPFVPYQALPGKKRSLVSRPTFKMAARFDRLTAKSSIHFMPLD